MLLGTPLTKAYFPAKPQAARLESAFAKLFLFIADILNLWAPKKRDRRLGYFFVVCVALWVIEDKVSERAGVRVRFLWLRNLSFLVKREKWWDAMKWHNPSAFAQSRCYCSAKKRGRAHPSQQAHLTGKVNWGLPTAEWCTVEEMCQFAHGKKYP